MRALSAALMLGGIGKPKVPGLPVFSLSTFWPSACMRSASSNKGPRMSERTCAMRSANNDMICPPALVVKMYFSSTTVYPRARGVNTQGRFGGAVYSLPFHPGPGVL